MRNYKIVWIRKPWCNRPGCVPYDQSIAANNVEYRRHGEMFVIPIDAELKQR